MKKLPKWRQRQLRNIGLFLLFIGLIYVLNYLHLTRDKSPVSPQENTVQYKVKYLYGYDGDTAVFSLEDNTEVVCRFLAVDAPEYGEEGYEEAKSFTNTSLRSAKEIILELEPHSDTYDRYDRLLAWVWTDGKLLQASLLENDLVEIRYLFDNYLYTDYLFRIKEQKNVTSEEQVPSRTTVMRSLTISCTTARIRKRR
mgnify:CR=1 FL=1